MDLGGHPELPAGAKAERCFLAQDHCAPAYNLNPLESFSYLTGFLLEIIVLE